MSLIYNLYVNIKVLSKIDVLRLLSCGGIYSRYSDIIFNYENL